MSILKTRIREQVNSNQMSQEMPRAPQVSLESCSGPFNSSCSLSISSLSNLLVSTNAMPSKFRPHRDFFCGAFTSPNPIPHTRSRGLASTKNVSPVSSSFLRKSGFCRNLSKFPSSTIRSRCWVHVASSKFSTARPSPLTSRRAVCDVDVLARTRRAIETSRKRRAFCSIIQCSAVGTVTLSEKSGSDGKITVVVNGAGYH